MLATLLVLTLLQSERALLEVEDSRAEDASLLVAALQNPNLRVKRLAVRALGRLERPTYAPEVARLLESSDPAIRTEAATALGQIGALVDLRPFLEKERDGAVRGVLYETLGRLPATDIALPTLLTEGLRDSSLEARVGAAKGLELFYRKTKTKPGPDAVDALRSAIRDGSSAALRELALLTLNAASDQDQETLSAALKDAEPQVRRLAVMGLKAWLEDPSHVVRYEALRFASSCERALAGLSDPSEHVVLLAIDKLGEGCAPAPLEKLVDEGGDWRKQSRALVSLAKVSPAAARARLGRFVEHPVWQARVRAAAAAKVVKDETLLARFLKDPHPNVIVEALDKPDDAVPALESSHYGLLIEAARKLKGWSRGPTAVPPCFVRSSA